MSLTACMGGGWCPVREKCQRYRAVDRREPAERLCQPARLDRWIPIQDAHVPGRVFNVGSVRAAA